MIKTIFHYSLPPSSASMSNKKCNRNCEILHGCGSILHRAVSVYEANEKDPKGKIIPSKGTVYHFPLVDSNIICISTLHRNAIIV